MRYQFLIFILIIALGSCAIFYPKNKSEYCASRIALLRDNVYLSDSTNMIYKFKSDTNLFYLIEERAYFGANCLVNWKKREIQQLIGKPSVNYNKSGDKNVWRYFFLFDKCGQPGEECPYWDIRFDKFNRVMDLKEDMLNRQPDGRP